MPRFGLFREDDAKKVATATRRILAVPATRNILHQPQQTIRQVAPGGTTGDGGGGDTDCGCSGRFSQGLPLDGDPTICCEGHDRLKADFGPVIGEKMLFHQGGDVWSTFSSDSEEDNPYEHECGELTDEYDLVLDISETPPRIRMEARDELNCDPVCAEWLLCCNDFQCFGPNEFKLSKFLGWEPEPDAEEIPLKRCVCLQPQPTVQGCSGSFYAVDACANDESAAAVFIRMPTISNGSSGTCGNFSGEHVLPVNPSFNCNFAKTIDVTHTITFGWGNGSTGRPNNALAFGIGVTNVALYTAPATTEQDCFAPVVLSLACWRVADTVAKL